MLADRASASCDIQASAFPWLEMRADSPDWSVATQESKSLEETT